jgi:hypothetical protein
MYNLQVRGAGLQGQSPESSMEMGLLKDMIYRIAYTR